MSCRWRERRSRSICWELAGPPVPARRSRCARARARAPGRAGPGWRPTAAGRSATPSRSGSQAAGCSRCGRAGPVGCTSRSWQPAAARCAPCGRRRRRRVSRPSSRGPGGGGRVDAPGGSALRRHGAHGLRASHRHAERLRARRRARDHPLDLHLPRALERLERHWLQLPGRRLRPCLRGPRRRHRPTGHRRAHRGLQHRQRGHRRDRERLAGAVDGGQSRRSRRISSRGGSTSRTSTRSGTRP